MYIYSERIKGLGERGSGREKTRLLPEVLNHMIKIMKFQSQIDYLLNKQYDVGKEIRYKE